MSGTKVVLIGKSKKEQDRFRDFLNGIEPMHIPKRMIYEVLAVSNNKKYKLSKKMLKDPLTFSDLKKHVESLDINESIGRIEIVIDLDLVEEEIVLQTESFLDMYFT